MKLNYYPETDSLYIDLSSKLGPKAGKFPKAWCLTTTLRVISRGLILITQVGNWICGSW